MSPPVDEEEREAGEVAGTRERVLREREFLLEMKKGRRRRKEEILVGSAGFVPKRLDFARSKRRRLVK